MTAAPDYYTRKKREWRAANRERDRVSNRQRGRHVRDLLWMAKARPCADCRVQYPPYVMQFDHRDPASKLFNIGTSPASRPLAALMDEIAKCDVVCANCHAERTHRQHPRGA